jgi:predicted esterase
MIKFGSNDIETFNVSPFDSQKFINPNTGGLKVFELNNALIEFFEKHNFKEKIVIAGFSAGVQAALDIAMN